PQFLPDNRHFIYHVQGSRGTAVYVGSLESERSKRLLDSEYPAAFAPPDHLLFLRGTALMAQRFDPGALSLNGEPELVSPNVAPGSVGGYALFSAANNRVLAYAATRLGLAGQLTWFDRNGRTIGSIPPLLGEEYLNPSISPDGHVVAANRMDPQ